MLACSHHAGAKQKPSKPPFPRESQTCSHPKEDIKRQIKEASGRGSSPPDGVG